MIEGPESDAKPYEQPQRWWKGLARSIYQSSFIPQTFRASKHSKFQSGSLCMREPCMNYTSTTLRILHFTDSLDLAAPMNGRLG